MATTDARSGFRLPWSSDRQAESESAADSTATDQIPSTDVASPEAGATSDASVQPTDGATTDPWTGLATNPAPTAPRTAETRPAADAPKATRKPNKFLADLTKAMQAAAEEARAHSLQQLQADAKTHIETIHGRSATEAASLRRQADDDVAAVREWSKTEIARIREETEQKITDRKSRLETEIEEHAAVIEREIDAVQRTVTAFEDEMAAFFERLLAEADPTRFATMAENLPEPPSFDEISAMIGLPVAPADTTPAVDAPIEAASDVEPEATAAEAEVVEPAAEAPLDAEAPSAGVVATDPPADGTDVAEATSVTDDATADAAEAPAEATSAAPESSTDEAEVPGSRHPGGEMSGELSFDGVEGEDGEVDREAAFAAIQAAAEAAASAEVAADAAARAEAVADVAIEIMGNHEGEDGEGDPRFTALGLSPDYDAAEAEAQAAADGSDPDAEEIPVIGDDALAARLAGLVPGKGEETSGETASTQIVVVGLISVASIASFKRHLGRLAGVRSVGVSSGPDGEFVFAVTHSTDTVLRDVIPSLPSFQARVTSSSDGVVHVTAHDPEADG